MNSDTTGVIKRSGKRPSEAFEHHKLETSIRAACLSVRCPDGEADMLAKMISDLVELWCRGKAGVTSHDLRRVASEHLERLHPEAAYFYQQHRAVI